jgi:hypothetical protein
VRRDGASCSASPAPVPTRRPCAHPRGPGRRRMAGDRAEGMDEHRAPSANAGSPRSAPIRRRPSTRESPSWPST